MRHINNHKMSINERIKARSITSKASSACKINMGLVKGEANVQASKGFTDYGEIIAKKMGSSVDAERTDSGNNGVLEDVDKEDKENKTDQKSDAPPPVDIDSEAPPVP
jgi:hypothetical protein